MYAPSFLARTHYADNAQLKADLYRWECQYAKRQKWCDEDLKQLQKQREIKKLFQREMLGASNMNAKAIFAPTYRDIKNDEFVYQSCAEVLQGEFDYPGMNELLAQLLIQQVKAGNRLAQKILIKTSQTFTSSNTQS